MAFDMSEGQVHVDSSSLQRALDGERDGIGGGLIAFDYGAKTFRFGAGVEEAEAQGIVTRLKSRHAFA